MTFQTLAVAVSARRIATVLLNRPERGNAFDQVMLDELVEALGALGGDPQGANRGAARQRPSRSWCASIY